MAFSTEDQFDEHVSSLDWWLMRLGKKATKDHFLDPAVTDGIRMFINNSFKNDIKELKESGFIDEMKPRL